MATHQPIDTPDLFQILGPHGNPNPLYIGAWKRGCRCAECVDTYQRYRHEYHKQRLARDPAYRLKCESHSRQQTAAQKAKSDELLAIPSQVEHASASWAVGPSGYTKGCRCAGCKAGQREYGKKLAAESRLTPEGRAMTLARSRRKWSRIKSNADRLARLAERARVRREKIGEWLRDLKVATGCVDCGYNAHACALDYDHVNGDKAFDVSQRRTMSKAGLLTEIAKCQLVCANCHRVRTYSRKRGG